MWKWKKWKKRKKMREVHTDFFYRIVNERIWESCSVLALYEEECDFTTCAQSEDTFGWHKSGHLQTRIYVYSCTSSISLNSHEHCVPLSMPCGEYSELCTNNREYARAVAMDNGWWSCTAKVCKLVISINSVRFKFNRIFFDCVQFIRGFLDFCFVYSLVISMFYEMYGERWIHSNLILFKFKRWNVLVFRTHSKCSFGSAICLCKMACKLFLVV